MTTIYAFSTIPVPILYANSVTAIPLNVASCAVPPQHRKLFIGGLNHETTDEQLREYYSRWGNVVDCIVIRDPVSRHSRGFGFITYATTEMADAAMADRPHTIGGKVVDPKRAIPREQMLQAMNSPPSFLDMEPAAEYKLILSGIHWDFHTVDALRHHFEEFGDVEQVEIMANPRGYGFVVFEEREAVERCLASSRSHCVNGKKVEIRESEPGEQWPIGSPPIIHHRQQRKDEGGQGGEDHHQKGTAQNHNHHGHLKQHHQHQQPYAHREQQSQPHRRFGRPIGICGIGGSGMAAAHHHQNGQQQIAIGGGGAVRIHHGSLGSQGQGSQSHSPVDSLQSSEPESPTNS